MIKEIKCYWLLQWWWGYANAAHSPAHHCRQHILERCCSQPLTSTACCWSCTKPSFATSFINNTFLVLIRMCKAVSAAYLLYINAFESCVCQCGVHNRPGLVGRAASTDAQSRPDDVRITSCVMCTCQYCRACKRCMPQQQEQEEEQ